MSPPRSARLVGLPSTMLALACIVLPPETAGAQQPAPWLRDRGRGMATSMFGTYVQRGELIVYPFYEYTTQNLEYKPQELGYTDQQDYRGPYREHEALIFLGWGVTDRLALELEGALYQLSTLRKAPDDTSALPARLRESGLGDIQAEARWRWAVETASRPEVFSYLETDFPFQRTRKLIGTQDWEFKLGTGVTRGFRFGTITVRAGAQYLRDERVVDFGEYAVEYVRRLSDRWQGYLGVEGEQDEVSFINEMQLRVGRRSVLKLNNAFGLTSKAASWAPEVGVAISF
jgi:hypothetical protein